MNTRILIPTSDTARFKRNSFTLVELLISIALVTMLASMSMFALFEVMEHAKETRTRAQIAKIHELVLTRWENYRSRAVRLTPPSTISPITVSAAKLFAIRDLQRMEFPDRISDVKDGPVSGVPQPAAHRSYDRALTGIQGSTWKTNGKWTITQQQAECLYLILSMLRENDESGLEYFTPGEIGDTDDDGMKEILDGFGRPIQWLRWAPGYSTGPGLDGQWGVAGTDDDGNGTTDDIDERGYKGTDDEDDIISFLQRPDPAEAPDSFDPMSRDKAIRSSATKPARKTFNGIPLVFSAGPDGEYDIVTDDGTSTINYSTATTINIANDPFYVITPSNAAEPPMQVGLPWDTDADGLLESLDNFTNHSIEAR